MIAINKKFNPYIHDSITLNTVESVVDIVVRGVLIPINSQLKSPRGVGGLIIDNM